MNVIQIHDELELIRLQIKLSITLKHYVLNSSHQEMNLFFKVLEILKKKYRDDSSTYNFIECVRCNLQNNNNILINISSISSSISTCSNVSALNDLLNCIDTGVSYVRQENI